MTGFRALYGRVCGGGGAFLRAGLVLAWAVWSACGATDTPAGLAPGILVAYHNVASGLTNQDVTVAPAVALFVPRGQSPTPFLRPGEFQAQWTGFVTCELRGQYAFEVETSGTFDLELNGQAVAFRSGAPGQPQRSGFVRLNKGTNSLRAVLTSAPDRDTHLRLGWVAEGGQPIPVPSRVLAHAPDSPGLAQATQLHLGRELFLEHRCARCHLPPTEQAENSELRMDAPTFEGIGSRRNQQWLAQWIEDPKALRSTARMPRMFQEGAREKSEAVAAFLTSLTNAPALAEAGPAKPYSSEAIENGKRRFEDLHCEACHTAPDAPGTDPDRVSLRTLAAKFSAGALPEFLQSPGRDYAWTRMPDFKLTQEEAGELAACLVAASEPVHALETPAVETALVARGRDLVQTSGCLNCHRLNLPNRFAAKPLEQLAPGRWIGGCLAAEPTRMTPFYRFSAQERSALQRLAAHSQGLLQEAPMEVAQRQMRVLRCGECHGKFDGFPSLEAMHGKLKPEWARRIIGGELTYRPRPWLNARMPGFGPYAEGLAAGMAMLHGYPPVTPPEPPLDAAAAAVGRKLAAAQGGLACISCHAVGRIPATQVFENAGVNLAYTHDRLLKPYFVRWVRNPLAIDPVSKMPVFFDEELRSPLTEFYDGDGAKQIEALWQYIRLGEKMPPPPGSDTSP